MVGLGLSFRNLKTIWIGKFGSPLISGAEVITDLQSRSRVNSRTILRFLRIQSQKFLKTGSGVTFYVVFINVTA